MGSSNCLLTAPRVPWARFSLVGAGFNPAKTFAPNQAYTSFAIA